MKSISLERLKFIPLVMILIGCVEASRQLIDGGLQGLVQLAQGCRNLQRAGPLEILSLFPIYFSDFSLAFWWLAVGVVLWLGWRFGREVWQKWSG